MSTLKELTEEMLRSLYPRGRQHVVDCLNEACGYDKNGCLIPPPPDAQINRAPIVWWRNRAVDAPIKASQIKGVTPPPVS